MEKMPVEFRINRAIENYPEKEFIAIHPDDYNFLKFEGRLKTFAKPLKKLGELSVENQ